MHDLMMFLFWIFGFWSFEVFLGIFVNALVKLTSINSGFGRILIVTTNIAIAFICSVEGSWITSGILESAVKYALYFFAIGTGSWISCSIAEWRLIAPKSFFTKEFYRVGEKQLSP